MKKIIISGEIGWDVTARGVRDQLKGIKSTEDLEIDMSSPGGSVFQGVEIANLLRDHKGKITLTVSGVALSMGSYISEMADVVRVHDNSSYMMHNPWMFTMGDFQELEKDAKFLKSLAGMMTPAYSAKSGKSKAAVQKLMNETTWLFGQEIVDAGFADELIETNSTQEKDEAVAFAKLQFKECMSKMKDFKGLEEEKLKIAAYFKDEPAAGPGKGRKVESKGLDIKPNKGKNMDIKLLSELKAEYPTLCAELVKEAMAAGKAELQDQVTGHILMGRSSGDLELCMKNLEEGKEFGSAEVQAGYMAAGMNKKDLQARTDDNPDGTETETDTELSEKAQEKALTDEVMSKSNIQAKGK